MAFPVWGSDWNSTGGGYYVSGGWVTYSGSASQPLMVAVPGVPLEPMPEPPDDSALGWLRGQVAEITELARSA